MVGDEVLTGDCLEILPWIPDEHVDMVFADPPFNLNKRYKTYKDSVKFNEYLLWCESWLLELVRITKPTGSIFIHNIPMWLTYYAGILNQAAHFKHWISWNAPGAPMKANLLPAHYGILYYEKEPKRAKIYTLRYPHSRCRKCEYLLKDYGGKKDTIHPFGPVVSDVWTDIHRIKHNKYRDGHPCQLPVHLLERIVLMSTDEGDLVLDPFLGTGTTALAAKRLGRRYTGIEIDPEYAKIAQGKLEQERELSKLGECWVSIYRDEIVTIRDADWESLSHHFDIPGDVKEVDFVKIKIMDKADEE